MPFFVVWLHGTGWNNSPVNSGFAFSPKEQSLATWIVVNPQHNEHKSGWHYYRTLLSNLHGIIITILSIYLCAKLQPARKMLGTNKEHNYALPEQCGFSSCRRHMHWNKNKPLCLIFQELLEELAIRTMRGYLSDEWVRGQQRLQ